MDRLSIWRSGPILSLAITLVHPTHAQNTTRPSGAVTFASIQGVSTTYTTTTYDQSATSTYLRQTDFSNERLAFLWDQVGPIETGPVTTTVTPTPEPSLYAQPDPDNFHPLVPPYIPTLSNYALPSDFTWGVSSSAYQVEGAADAEGKGPSIWDLLSHRVPGLIADNTTGDVVASHYYLYKQDFARLKALGIPAFTPSISWPRIFPFGKGPINEAGVAHYDDVIRELVANGIKISITLFHWDTPLALFNEYGAWNDRQIVDDYFNYATFIIQRYDQYVNEWFTINEPQYCNWQFSTYPAGEYYPAYNNITGGVRSRFLCGHHTLLAHAKVAKWYKNEFRGRHRITFKNSGNYFEPNSTSEADLDAAQRQYDYSLGWFNNPVWNDGQYPQNLRDTLGDLLPNFTAEESELVRGSCDFFAVDPYTSYYASAIDDKEACVRNSSASGFPECAGSQALTPRGFSSGPSSDTGTSWLTSAPSGLRKYLNKITKELFPSVPEIVVTEFGFAEPGEGKLNDLGAIQWDLRRADYYQGYLDNILAARVYDGVNVTGAWGWAIFDNYEWFVGNQVRFGMQYVNYTSLERHPKASMFQFLNWFNTKGRGFAGAGNSTVTRKWF
ncbi:hypothetical protein CAC42_5828 [Sphaceloma murrayae]|uniref:Uncharacterized protein n=1 Tax=Sphaceloma murrayae TaxID=2082308 RepID=A0A2K1QZB1_9PEZI|nr:hypothetical protein CAC42_5828 [Sphaceloma murrayae]